MGKNNWTQRLLRGFLSIVAALSIFILSIWLLWHLAMSESQAGDHPTYQLAGQVTKLSYEPDGKYTLWLATEHDPREFHDVSGRYTHMGEGSPYLVITTWQTSESQYKYKSMDLLLPQEVRNELQKARRHQRSYVHSF